VGLSHGGLDKGKDGRDTDGDDVCLPRAKLIGKSGHGRGRKCDMLKLPSEAMMYCSERPVLHHCGDLPDASFGSAPVHVTGPSSSTAG
jgi:hypothetical protein